MRSWYHRPTPEQVRQQMRFEHDTQPATRADLRRAEERIMLRLDMLFTELTGKPPLSTWVPDDTDGGGR